MPSPNLHRRVTRKRRLPLACPRGVRVGHAVDPSGPSGTTVVLFDRPARVVAAVHGPASGTYDIGSLAVSSTFGRRDALFFSGGSLFGLDAARGVRTRLLELGRGEPALGSAAPLPRVSGAILFDLPAGARSLPEYLALGYTAASAASPGLGVNGRLGAGSGARVAKYAGKEFSRPGGVGIAGRRLSQGHLLALLIVFNSGGAIRDPESGAWLVTARRGPKAPILPFSRRPSAGAFRTSPATTLAAILTDLPLDRRDLAALADYAHDSIARTVVPTHTSFEGDVVFVASTSTRAQSEREPGIRGLAMDALGGVVSSLVADAARGFARTVAVS
ncbi:MAG: P1 family peptidase [Thermoplasmata archaeon]|nr:P1 family peptidase [Thermoplasmata archaeon]